MTRSALALTSVVAYLMGWMPTCGVASKPPPVGVATNGNRSGQQSTEVHEHGGTPRAVNEGGEAPSLAPALPPGEPDGQPDQGKLAPSNPGQAAKSETEPRSPCPDDMVLVDGQHCYLFEQVCRRWDDPEGQPENRVCAEFEAPSHCKGAREKMRFCIDRNEYVAPGETIPLTGASWEKAATICKRQGKRLCKSPEWLFACEGEEGRPYPYGYQRTPSLCNQDRLLRDGKNKAKADLREPPHPTCVSPFGVRDMVGNVDEWVQKSWAQPPNRSELRGGWWMTGRNRCRAATVHHDEKYAGPQTGVRCCKSLTEHD